MTQKCIFFVAKRRRNKQVVPPAEDIHQPSPKEALSINNDNVTVNNITDEDTIYLTHNNNFRKTSSQTPHLEQRLTTPVKTLLASEDNAASCSPEQEEQVTSPLPLLPVSFEPAVVDDITVEKDIVEDTVKDTTDLTHNNNFSKTSSQTPHLEQKLTTPVKTLLASKDNAASCSPEQEKQVTSLQPLLPVNSRFKAKLAEPLLFTLPTLKIKYSKHRESWKR